MSMSLSITGISVATSALSEGPSATATGRSSTGTMLKVIVFGVGSVSTPPLSVRPLSRTWN